MVKAYLLLFDLAIIVLAARVAGSLVARIGQPPVIGEILSGILFGATLFDGAIARTLFPSQVQPLLGAWADLGVAIFMFLVGLELDRTLLRGQVRSAVSVALSSVLFPFGLGVAIAFPLARSHTSHLTAGFILYIGTTLSVTAFPMLVRILRDRSLLDSPLGVLACACAAMADVLAWALLAVVIAISRSGSSQTWRLALLLPYLAVLLWGARPVLRRYLGRQRDRRATPGVLAVVLVGMLLSAAATDWMGLHFIFGAFIFGVVIPKDELADQVEAVGASMDRFNEVLLLPVFFVTAGLPVNLSNLGPSGLPELGMILAAAIGGKLGGTFLAAQASRIGVRQSAALAALMNTRGLTELIILTAGRQLGLLDNRLYTLLVITALVTTAMTGPLLRLIKPDLALARTTTSVPPGVISADVRNG